MGIASYGSLLAGGHALALAGHAGHVDGGPDGGRGAQGDHGQVVAEKDADGPKSTVRHKRCSF